MDALCMVINDNDWCDDLYGLPPAWYLGSLEFDSLKEDNRPLRGVEFAA